MAKDVLAVPVTTVALQSTFSAGERVLDQYRSSLKPETMQALICTADWIACHYKLSKKSATVCSCDFKFSFFVV